MPTEMDTRPSDDISDTRSPVWIVGDGLHNEAGIAAHAASLRVTRQLTCTEALASIDDRPPDTLILIDLAHNLSVVEETLLDRVDAQADTAQGAAVIAFPLAVLDAVAARISAPYATLLCAPDLADRIAAIGLARLPPTRHLAEADTLAEAMRLQKLAEEVSRIARTLAGLADDAPAGRAHAVSDGLIGYRVQPTADVGAAIQVSAADIRTMIRLRRQRDALFGDAMFGDPAWDMMLDLTAARIERVRVAVSSLCIAAAVPPTTALRWIGTLTEAGLFVRVPDPTDRRRMFLELSDGAASRVIDLLGKAKRAGVALV